MERFDVIIIGAGPGGYEVAAELAASGSNVAVIERDKPGGTCLNRGCIPTKCLCATAAHAIEATKAAEFGVRLGEISVDYGVARMRMRRVVDNLREGVNAVLGNVRYINGEAVINPDGTISVNDRQYAADKMLIATGSKPARPAIPGIEHTITSDELLELEDTLPQRITIVGGGVIGIEFASIFCALGSKVTVVEYCKEILPLFDADIAKRLRLSLKARGVEFITGAAVKSIEEDRSVIYETRKGAASMESDLVLVATGRSPVVPSGTSEAGIELDDKGFIVVDDAMCTTRPGFYAAGDVTGICMLAHAAAAQARRALIPEAEDVELNIIPSAVFSYPEAAMVGLTPAQCTAHGIEYLECKAPYAANGKAQADGCANGVVKIVYSPATRLILGVHVLGEHASDIVAEAAALIYGMITVDDLASDLIHGHPTLSEILQAAAKTAK
ncbi:MAG: dihydrolipoyl dehydrogenase [Muribaculaceae bacterium]|nr:dihydrolipoyl dehydrogenase [Muribaculaceae bacterium]